MTLTTGAFFSTNFLGSAGDGFAHYDATKSASPQGQLSSAYEAALSAQVKALADYVGFIYAQQPGVSLEDAVAVRDAISSGNFKLADLQNSGQSKTGPVLDPAGDPDPKVLVNGVSISIKDMLGGLDTETWKDSGKNGQYHTREFYTSTQEPHGFDPHWADPPKVNEAPTANYIFVNATETQSEFGSDHQRTNLGADLKYVDLLQNASDPDGDALHTDNYKFFDADGNPIGKPSYITFDGDTLVIDQNDRALDDLLKKGDHLKLSVTYDIDDGNGHTISNAAYIDIVGTADIYEVKGVEGSVEKTHLRGDSSTGGGNINGNVLAFTLPADNDDHFDFKITGGKLTATETGLTGNQKVNVVDAGSADWGDAINLTASHTTQTVNVPASALSDKQVDYNVGFNTDDKTDSVTVHLDYTYDYWHWA